MITANETNIASIHEEATKTAVAASQALFEKHGSTDMIGACGFAWVTVYGVKLNTKLGKVMKSLGFDKAYGGGIQIWNPGQYHGQNVDFKEAGAYAYAKVLESYGLKAYAGSRLD